MVRSFHIGSLLSFREICLRDVPTVYPIIINMHTILCFNFTHYPTVFQQDVLSLRFVRQVHAPRSCNNGDTSHKVNCCCRPSL